MIKFRLINDEGKHRGYEWLDENNYRKHQRPNKEVKNGVNYLPFTRLKNTGLLDKNGKEIYGGDIVRVVQTKNTKDLGRHKKEALGVVGYNDLFHSCIFVGDEEYSIDFALEGEVIGNKRENPELLQS